MAQVPSLDDFTAAATTFLDTHATRKEATRAFVWGEGSDNVAMFEERHREDEERVVAEARRWRTAKFDAGFGWITGPTEFGGAGLPGAYERAWNALESRYRVPAQGIFTIGLGMVAPTILAHGSQRAKETYLRAMWRADIIGCQLFSEPGAGSDLASLQMKAERDGDEWVITGQKVWTSGAQFSDIGEIVCRSDASLPKHKGITAFIVDMHAPGVDVRPLRQMTGGASFNEVFFNEVRIPDWCRLGDINAGWGVALTTLMNERAAIGSLGGGDVSMFSRVLGMVRHFGRDGDPVVRDMLADLYVHNKVAAFTNKRALDKLRAGQTPGPEMSISKMALVENQRRIIELVSHVAGPRLQADGGEWGTYAWSAYLLGAPGLRIAGGSDEVMRNIVAERVLGLPKETGIDSTSPFKDLKVGTQQSN